MATALIRITTLLVLSLPLGGFAQEGSQAGATDPSNRDTKIPRFEVVSVRQYKGPEPRFKDLTNAPDGFYVKAMTLREMIGMTYLVRWDAVLNGPSWMDKIAFDVQAKVADADVETLKHLSSLDRRTMAQELLADRFHLRAHRETRISPVFELAVVKGGAKVKSVAPAQPVTASSSKAGRVYLRPGQITGRSASIRNLAAALTGAFGRVVVDKTGLTGLYDFDLRWTLDDAPNAFSNGANPADEAGILTSLREELGLEVRSAKAPVEVLVVDNLEMPAAN